MEIIVCIKQVPDTTEVRTDPKTGTLIREGVPSIVNPDDRHAVEEALRLREKYGGTVTAISMGPPQAADALVEVYGMGVDEVILLSDRRFAGADTWATAYTLSKAVERVGKYDLLLLGRQAIDGDTSQIGPQLAEALGIPQVTYVRKVEVEQTELVVERALEDGHMRLKVPMPCLLTAISELNRPRYPALGRIVEALRTGKVQVWNADDVGAEPEKCGLKGSPTQVARIFAPPQRGNVELLEGGPREQVMALVDRLKERNVVRK